MPDLPAPAAESEPDPLRSFDGLLWAREFMQLLNDDTFANNGGVDEALMVGWFANALMRGYDEGALDVHRLEARIADLERERDGLLRRCAAYERSAIEWSELKCEGARLERELAAARLEIVSLTDALNDATLSNEVGERELAAARGECQRMRETAEVTLEQAVALRAAIDASVVELGKAQVSNWQTSTRPEQNAIGAAIRKLRAAQRSAK
jgi:chromosome segregation ATPase